VPGDIEVDEARGRGDVAELADIMLAMAQHHQVEIALRRVAARQRRKALLAQHLVDRAQPVGAFGVAWRRQMVETGGMRQ
jgi:hypothetical protein